MEQWRSSSLQDMLGAARGFAKSRTRFQTLQLVPLVRWLIQLAATDARCCQRLMQNAIHAG